ncbi:MAG: type II secretion system major pseudopilin GspG [Steroidobacteraceae bacterium]
MDRRFAKGSLPGHARGFTLLELMVVLLILALLASIAAPRVIKDLSRAKTQTAKIEINALSEAVDAYHLDTGEYPSTQQGLEALLKAPTNTPTWDGPYVKKAESLNDPWGHPYLYRYPGQHGAFDVYTFGSDQKEGGTGEAQDVGNW